MVSLNRWNPPINGFKDTQLDKRNLAILGEIVREIEYIKFLNDFIIFMVECLQYYSGGKSVIFNIIQMDQKLIWSTDIMFMKIKMVYLNPNRILSDN